MIQIRVTRSYDDGWMGGWMDGWMDASNGSSPMGSEMPGAKKCKLCSKNIFYYEGKHSLLGVPILTNKHTMRQTIVKQLKPHLEHLKLKGSLIINRSNSLCETD